MSDPGLSQKTEFKEATYKSLIPGYSHKSPEQLPQTILLSTHVPKPQTEDSKSQSLVPDSFDKDVLIQTDSQLQSSASFLQNAGIVWKDTLDHSVPPEKPDQPQETESRLPESVNDSATKSLANAQYLPLDKTDNHEADRVPDLHSVSDDEVSIRARSSQTRRTDPTATNFTTPVMATNKASRKSATTTKTTSTKSRSSKAAPASNIKITNNGPTSASALLQMKREEKFTQLQNTQPTVPTDDPQSLRKSAIKPTEEPFRNLEQQVASVTSGKPQQPLPSTKPKAKSQPIYGKNRSGGTSRPSNKSDPIYELEGSPKVTKNPIRDPKPSMPDVPKAKRPRGRPRKQARVDAEDEDMSNDSNYHATNKSKTEPASSTRATRANVRATKLDLQEATQPVRQLQGRTETLPVVDSKKLAPHQPHASDQSGSSKIHEERIEDFEDNVTNLNADQSVEMDVVVRSEPPELSTVRQKQPSSAYQGLEDVAPLNTTVSRNEDSRKNAGRVKVKTEELRESDPHRTPASNSAPGNSQYNAISVPSDDSDDEPDATISVTGHEVQEHALSQRGLQGQQSPIPNRSSPSLHRHQKDTMPVPSVSADTEQARPAHTEAMLQDRTIRKPNIIDFDENGPKNQGSIGRKSVKRTLAVSQPADQPVLEEHNVTANPLKRQAEGDNQRPPKRVKSAAAEVQSHVQPIVRHTSGLRQYSQITVDGSPVPQGREGHSETQMSRSSDSENASEAEAVPISGPLFVDEAIPVLWNENRSKKREHDTDVEHVGTQLASRSVPVPESQAISHDGLEGASRGSSEQIELPAQNEPLINREQLFAGTTEVYSPQLAAACDKTGFKDTMLSKASHSRTRAVPDELEEALEDMEDDPDKTLVNEMSDVLNGSDSEGSSYSGREDRNQDQMMLWRKALKPYQGNVHDTLVRIAHGFVAQLVDHETAIEDICNDYREDATFLIEEFEAKHENELEVYTRRVCKMHRNMAKGFRLITSTLSSNMKTVQESCGQTVKTLQVQEDASERLKRIMQTYGHA